MPMPSDFSLSSPVPTDVLQAPGNQLEGRIRAAQSASGEKQKDELKKVSEEFEAIFIAYLLKVMRETIEESGLTEGGFGKSMYTEMFDQEMSQVIARRGALGISGLLYKNLENDSVPPPADLGPLPKAVPGPPLKKADSTPSAQSEISDLLLPLRAPVSSPYGVRRDPFTHQAKFHKGLDFAAPEGTSVLAPSPGKVIFAGYNSEYGRTILIQHASGLQTRYGHLNTIKVKAGDYVDSEAVLGTVGNTGRSTGPHLHFEVIRMGKSVDPLTESDFQTVTAKQLRSSSNKS